MDRDVRARLFGFQLNRKVHPLYRSAGPLFPSVWFFLIKLPRTCIYGEELCVSACRTKGIKNYFCHEVGSGCVEHCQNGKLFSFQLLNRCRRGLCSFENSNIGRPIYLRQ